MEALVNGKIVSKIMDTRLTISLLTKIQKMISLLNQLEKENSLLLEEQ